MTTRFVFGSEATLASAQSSLRVEDRKPAARRLKNIRLVGSMAIEVVGVGGDVLLI